MVEKKKTTKQDNLVYKALLKAIDADKLRIYLDYGKINRPGSPVYDPWECLLPILLPTVIGLLLILSVNIIFGLIFIVAMIFAYTNYFKKKLYKNIIDRTKKYIQESLMHLEDLWNFGGIVFVNAENKKFGCVSPDGDWKDFVVLNFSTYMTAKEEEKKDEEETDEITKENFPKIRAKNRPSRLSRHDKQV